MGKKKKVSLGKGEKKNECIVGMSGVPRVCEDMRETVMDVGEVLEAFRWVQAYVSGRICR